MLKIDEKARSSMWDDLQMKRTTEVNELNGAVVRLAQANGTKAPLNAKMVELIQLAEGGQMKGLSGSALLQKLN
jgi:2-dehydropantoate 2-reductase